MAVQQAMLEAAGVPGAVVVVQPALAFQAPVHQLAAIARAVRQARIGREQRFAPPQAASRMTRAEQSERDLAGRSMRRSR